MNCGLNFQVSFHICNKQNYEIQTLHRYIMFTSQIHSTITLFVPILTPTHKTKTSTLHKTRSFALASNLLPYICQISTTIYVTHYQQLWNQCEQSTCIYSTHGNWLIVVCPLLNTGLMVRPQRMCGWSKGEGLTKSAEMSSQYLQSSSRDARLFTKKKTQKRQEEYRHYWQQIRGRSEGDGLSVSIGLNL